VLTRISVDGRIQGPEDAVVRVLDHGVLFGDSVYEVLWWHRGALIQAAEHWERLEASAARLYMDLQHTREALEAAVRATVRAAEVGPEDDALVRVVVKRGVGVYGLDLRTPPRRTLIVLVAPAQRPGPEAFERGVALAIVARRRVPPQALDPRAKTGNYLNNVLALHEAHLAGADDALFLNEAGDVAEATTANVYVVKDGVLRTPPSAAGILEGTTRQRVLALCRRAGVGAREAVLRPEDLRAADEIVLSSSVKGILPGTRLDGVPIGTGTAGPVARRLKALFEEAADQEARAAARVAVP
jgi:branched-chain amino acid aminotransferase